MGRFFTSTQILNEERLGKDDFLKKFCEKMKEEGYVKCDEEESAEISYVFAFSENEKCKWVTMSSESYETGNAKAEKDTSRVAKMLGTICINTVVIDSDCVILNLYDKSGKNADMFAIGIADDYLGDDIPEPKKEIWEKLLNEECDWEQLMEICQESDAEGGLSEIASIIDADEELILFEAGGIFDYNADVVTVGFKKKTAEKKLSLYAGFKKVYGEYLEPYGFKLVKSKHPYFVRVVDDEIVQIISVKKEKTIDYKSDFELLEIYVGFGLLSLTTMDFDKAPWHIDSLAYMETLESLYQRYSKKYGTDEFVISEFKLPYKSRDNNSLMTTLSLSLEKFMPLIFEVYNITQTLNQMYYYAEKMLVSLLNDIAVLTGRVDDRLKSKEENLKNKLVYMEDIVCKKDKGLFEIHSKKVMERYTKEIQWLEERRQNGVKYDEYIEKSRKTRDINKKYLLDVGVEKEKLGYV